MFQLISYLLLMFFTKKDTMKKLLSNVTLLLILLIFTLCGCNNENEITVDGILYKKITCMIDGEPQEVYSVIGCESEISVLNIAAEVKGLPVYRLEKSAFKNNCELKEVVIPDSIGHIALQTAPFSGCNSIEKITTPFSNIILLFNSYGGNSSGNTMPDSLKCVYLSKKCTKISTCDFYNCANLSEIHIPNSVTTINDGTNSTSIGVNGNSSSTGKFSNLPFWGCTNLKIFCETSTKPDGWDTYWNYIDSEHFADVNWNSY